MKNIFNDFIEKETNEKDLCKHYKDYPYTVQQMLKRIYLCCFRFNLYKSQTKFILNEALEPFAEDMEEKDLLDL